MSDDRAGFAVDSEPPVQRGPRIVDLLVMCSLPLLFVLIDSESLHQAGAPRRWWRRLRARAARLIAGEHDAD